MRALARIRRGWGHDGDANPLSPRAKRAGIPRELFTLRGLMAVVVVVAVILGGVQSWRFHRLAQHYSEQSAIFARAASYWTGEERRAMESAKDWQMGEDEFRRKTGSPLPSPSAHHIAHAHWTAKRFAHIAD